MTATLDGRLVSVRVGRVRVHDWPAIGAQSAHSWRTAYFKDPRPTRTTVVVAKLVGEGHIEITTTARK